MGIALPLLGVAGVALFITGLFLLLRYAPVFEEHYYPRISELIVTSSKLHAEITLTESAVGLGSLNFTET
ncbi:MAG: hypothetical protein ACO2OR_06135 [Desulfurococcaceae archaeon]